MLSELAFGKLRGCFEYPLETKEPNKNVDCPDVLPLQYSDRVPRREAMEHSSPLVHPDVDGYNRYCLGTGLQMKDTGKSHKLNTCKYHDPNNSPQGKYLKTMTQEGLQVSSHKKFS